MALFLTFLRISFLFFSLAVSSYRLVLPLAFDTAFSFQCGFSMWREGKQRGDGLVAWLILLWNLVMFLWFRASVISWCWDGRDFDRRKSCVRGMSCYLQGVATASADPRYGMLAEDLCMRI